MPQAIIENFKAGLDTRRSELTSALGVLATLQDCFINPGAEIEKRKAFIGTSITPTIASGVSATYGIEALKESQVVFGGEANLDVANWPPTGFTYQRLYRPATDASEAVNATGVIFSTVFNNKTFVIAEMSDGVVNCFYDGELIKDINFYGRILPDMDEGTNDLRRQKLVQMMKLVFENIDGYTAELNDGNPAVADGIIITGQEGKLFDVEALGTGVWESEDFDVDFVSSPVAGIPGARAIGSFTIDDIRTGQPTVHYISQITVGVTNLLTGNVGCDTSPEFSAAAVAAAINTNSGTSGYTATNSGATVFIKAVATGVTANGKLIAIATSGRVLIGSVPLAFYGDNFTVDSIRANGVNLLTNVQTMNVAAGAETATTAKGIERLCTNIETEINANTGTTGYTALARGSIVKIGKRDVQSSFASTETQTPDKNSVPIVVSITPISGGDVNVANDKIKIFWETTKCDIYEAPGLPGITKDPIKFVVRDAVQPYYFEYIVESTNGLRLNILSPASQQTHVQQTQEIYNFVVNPRTGIPYNISLVNAQMAATIKVKVIDAGGNEATSSAIGVNFIQSSASYVRSLTP